MNIKVDINSSDGNLKSDDKDMKDEKSVSIHNLGTMKLPNVKSEIHCVAVVGQVERRLVLSPQNKTTKYEHVIPQLVLLEQSKDIK